MRLPLLLDMLAASPDGAVCADHVSLSARLAAGWSETRESIVLSKDGWVAETAANVGTGPWSIVRSDPAGVSCIVAAGEAREAVKEPQKVLGWVRDGPCRAASGDHTALQCFPGERAAREQHGLVRRKARDDRRRATGLPEGGSSLSCRARPARGPGALQYWERKGEVNPGQHAPRLMLQALGVRGYQTTIARGHGVLLDPT